MSKEEYRNILLLVASMIFYAWGEPVYIILMLISIIINYILGILVGNPKNKGKRVFLIIAVLINLGLLGVFKYASFFVANFNTATNRSILPNLEIILPIGISFYTFQALSYVIDVYRGGIKPQKNLISLALYVSFFPQLIAGPIVKYHDIQTQLDKRVCNRDKLVSGIKRFLYGLGKKMIFANALGEVADRVFSLEISQISFGVAWVGIICYTIQIYYDFSGYSDMAIGLGRMFGFEFIENFNYPYISESIKEFWRRWHISLSTWFKEYLYIPLGGSRKGELRTYFNLVVVFFCTGLWHGASWNFVIWGMFHGSFQIIERLFLSKILNKNPLKILNRIYTMGIVMIGWVFFRVETLEGAMAFLKRMFTLGGHTLYGYKVFLTPYIIVILVLAILFSGIIQSTKIGKFIISMKTKNHFQFVEVVLCSLIMIIVTVLLACGTYNPFIYFKF